MIDEQHRFGVVQRLTLKTKAYNPHILMMSATPIPRTLAMSIFDGISTLTLKSKPYNRKKTLTYALVESKKNILIEKLISKIKQAEQVFWVCPAIDQNDDMSNVEEVFKELQQYPAMTAVLHGRMSGEQKNQVISDFRLGKIDILVATTIIEVGIDIPQAHYMVIENANRLGLAQLHQLRGRVGRDDKQGFCFMIYQEKSSIYAKKRLSFLIKYDDGFQISKADLKLRGPGEFIGQKQSGDLNFLRF